ncbi:MAG: dihydropteroate synthase [Candidatus Omnitrophica bacterium]|nr:dihydropteroate synthase [Candidatus Omnitrophota bacterium]
MPLPQHKIYSDRTYIMGVLNVTPDSFFDKGKFFDHKSALRHGLKMAAEGADIIDIGGESTRPGAKEVSVSEELDRVIPVIEAVAKKIKKPISIDTRKSKVAIAAVKSGAKIINDVSALKFDPEMAGAAAKYKAVLILMHMKGTPQDMQKNPKYGDCIKEIISDLKRSIGKAKKAGVAEEKIIIDPGIGFGKTKEHNLEILRRLNEFKALRFPVCIGTSRKSFIGKILGMDDPKDRLAGTLATYTVAIMNGANILRVHDVKEAVEAARVTDSIVSKYGKTRR